MSFAASPERSAQLFRYLFEQASLGIAVEDLNGRLLLANPALCSMLGYREEELCAMHCSEFINPEDCPEEEGLFQKLREGLIDHYSLEKRYLRKDGAQIWGRLNISLLKGIGGEAPLLFAFVEEITESKRALEALRESAERLRLAAQAGKMYAYEWNVATDEVVRSSEYLNVLGLISEPIRLTRQQLIDKIHPDDRAKFIAAVDDLTPENPTCHVTYRMLLPDNTVSWLEKHARAFFDPQGKMLRVIGMVADVTEHKLAEKALSQVSRRLIEAQEKERKRIGRDLHDDIAQRLSLLAVELQAINGTLPESAAEVSGRISKLWEEVSEMLNDVHALSHELHSSRLEYLGIVVAMKSFCKEFGEQQRIRVGFRSHDLPVPLPSPEISLCLFRVLQEALQNAAKHSGSRDFQVELWATEAEIHLRVSDFGEGFDPKTTRKGTGIGLTSMKERLKLVNGELSIESRPQRGTTIHARVPLRSEADFARAAG